MAEQSHREEMSAAIRAQRERQAVPRSLAAPADEPPEPAAAEPQEPDEPEHGHGGFLSRLRGR